MKNDFLTREIIRKIFCSLGISPPPNFGKIGISTEEMKSQNVLTFMLEDGSSQSFPIWAGEIFVDDAIKVRTVFCDLSTDDVNEYVVIIKFDNKPLYGLKLIYDNDDNGIFVIGDKQKWERANLIAKAKALIGIETIVSCALEWQSCQQIEDILESLSAVAGM